MDPRLIIAFLVVLGSIALGLIAVLIMSVRKSRLDKRLDELKSGKDEVKTVAEPAPRPVRAMAARALPTIGSQLMPQDERERTLLQARLIQAGLYRRQAMPLFLGVKMILMVAPAIIGMAGGLTGLYRFRVGLLCGACFGIIGMIGPSIWLDRRKSARQVAFRRGLPDALDVIVICVEGGLSLVGALRRVAADLRTVHPDLAFELDIVQREVQLGQSVGDALRRFGERADMEELRSLASVIIQSERFGAGLNKALKVHADTLRFKRQQRAEEMAQKAGTKILFPTLLCIFPVIFVVILGPAIIQVSGTLLNTNK